MGAECCTTGSWGQGSSSEIVQAVRSPTSETGSGDRSPGKSARALGTALQERGQRTAVTTILDDAVDQLAGRVGRSRACQVMGRSRASHYRARITPKPATPDRPPRRPPAHTYPAAERAKILRVLNSEEFADLAPAQIFGRLLDEGTYLCSIRTMYRILADNHLVRERRHKTRHPKRTPPTLKAKHKTSDPISSYSTPTGAQR